MTTIPYVRRSDYDDLPLPNKLGILKYELEIAATDEEKANALASIAQLEAVIEKFTVRPPSGRPDQR
jgi:uncharacterized protein YqcC (DUF446 family)